MLRRKLDQAEGQDAIELLLQLGELYESKLSEPSTAVDNYESVLSQQPTLLRAQEALERLSAWRISDSESLRFWNRFTRVKALTRTSCEY